MVHRSPARSGTGVPPSPHRPSPGLFAWSLWSLVAGCVPDRPVTDDPEPVPTGVCANEATGSSALCHYDLPSGIPYTGQFTRWERTHVTFTALEGTVVDYEYADFDPDIWALLPDLSRAGEVTMVDGGGTCGVEVFLPGKSLYVYRGTPPDETPLLLFLSSTGWSHQTYSRWSYQNLASTCTPRQVEWHCVDSVVNFPVEFTVDGESATLYQGEEAILGGNRVMLFKAEDRTPQSDPDCVDADYSIVCLAIASDSLY